MMKSAALLISVCALVAGSFGCAGGYVEATYPSGAYIEVGPPAVDIDTYPRYWYGGHWVYDVHGTYYRADGGRWYRYNERPRDLGTPVYGGRVDHRNYGHEPYEHEHEHEHDGHDGHDGHEHH